MTSCLWYRVRLAPDQIVAGHLEIIRRRFVRAVARAGTCAGACLFVTSDETCSARPHQDAAEDQRAVETDVIFFSPASISLIPRLLARYDGEPSGPPDRGHAALLVGDERDWALLPFSSH
jgi:hypothetical protein